MIGHEAGLGDRHHARLEERAIDRESAIYIEIKREKQRNRERGRQRETERAREKKSDRTKRD